MQKLQPTHRQPLWPAIRYFLLLGQWPPNRTTKPHRPLGWVALTELVALGHDAAVRRAAAAYAADLAEEAASFGFEPWAVKRRRPKGPAVDHWRESFLDDLSNWY